MLGFKINSSTVELNEKSLKDAATKTLKYARAYHQDSFKLEDKDILHDTKLNYSPLTSDNIHFRFDEYGLLHIKFVNLKLIVSGKHNYSFGFFRGDALFTARLNNFN